MLARFFCHGHFAICANSKSFCYNLKLICYITNYASIFKQTLKNENIYKGGKSTLMKTSVPSLIANICILNFRKLPEIVTV